MEYKSIQDIFEAFKKIKVLIIGDVMVDAYIWGAVERISPEAPVPVVRATKRDYRLGGAANVGLNVQALGAQPILCSVIGKDDQGEKLIGRLKERHIDASGIVTSAQRPTTVKTRVLSGHQHVVRVDEETDKPLSRKEEDLILEKIKSLVSSVDVIVFEDYDKGCVTDKVIEETVKIATDHNKPVVVDPKKRNFLNYKGVTLFKPNFKELKEGLKKDIDKYNQSEIESAVDELMGELQCQGVMVTLSERGVYIKHNNEKHFIPAHIREIADVSGAGDTVISIVALCVALNLTPFLVAALSNLGGGLVCEHVGVVPIDHDELLAEAERHNWI